MYQVPDLGAGMEERERPWWLTLEALRHSEQEEELRQQAIPAATQPPDQAPRSQQALASAAGPAAALITPRHFAFSSDETFQLVRQLFLAAGDNAPRVVVFCTVEGSNADSLISARAAELLAHHTRRSVCLVDANLANPSLHTHFGVENREGLAEGIVKRSSIQELARPVGANGVRLISAGVLSAKMDSDALIASGHLRAWISQLRAGFGHVLVNAPPALGDRVTSCLAALTDGVILLVEPNFTPQQAARQAKEDIEAAGGRLLGVVLWRRPLRSLSRTGSSRRGPKASKKF
jgi:Mrp family chromosome partitioning ATPase